MRQALRAVAASPVHYERRRSEETTLYRVVQENLETFLAEVEAGGAASLPQFVKDEFDEFLECGIRAHGFLRVRRAECGHEKLAAFSCKRRGICPSCGGRRMAETAAWLVDRVIPKVPVRQWVLSFPIPLRSLFAVHPEVLAPVLQIIHRVIATHLIKQAGVKRSEAATGAVTLIQRLGSAANLNIPLHGHAVGFTRRKHRVPVGEKRGLKGLSVDRRPQHNCNKAKCSEMPQSDGSGGDNHDSTF